MAERGTGSARRRRERRLRAQWRHEHQTVATALAAATHHSAQRGEWRDLHEAPRGQRTASAEATYDALRSQTTSVAGDTEFFSLYEKELGGTRPDRLYEVRPQGRVQRRTVEQIVDTTLIVPSLDVPVPQRENHLVEGCRHLDLPIPEQAIEVPKISSTPRPPRRRRGGKCRRLYPILRYVGLWSRTWTFQFLMVVEVVSVSEVFKVFIGQSSTAFGEAWYFPAATAEQTVDTLVPRGDRTLHPASSSVLPVTANQWVFSTFPRGKKVRGRARTRGRNCSPSRAHPRRRLSWHRRFFMRASGRTMLVVCGCSFLVVGGNFWARTQKSGGQGKAGTVPSSCVSLRALLKVFPVHRARAVRTWNLCIISSVFASGSIAEEYGNLILREMTFLRWCNAWFSVDICSASVLWWLWKNLHSFCVMADSFPDALLLHSA